VGAAYASLPAGVAGPFGGLVTAIDFHYGRYCPPGTGCPFAGRGDIGFVIFTFRDRSTDVVNVMADQNGVVSVPTEAPAPSGPTP
jgi:hypothetical protein